MSNYSSCLCILTQLIGFEESDNDEKITLQLPDQVEIDKLVEFKQYLQDNTKSKNINDNNVPSYEMKMTQNESFWACLRCTYHNAIELNECEMCGLTRNVC